MVKFKSLVRFFKYWLSVLETIVESELVTQKHLEIERMNGKKTWTKKQ
jgi:hypothetical protein